MPYLLVHIVFTRKASPLNELHLSIAHLYNIRVCAILEPRLLFVLRVGELAHFLHHLFTEHLCWCLPPEAFARGVVQPITDHLHVLICDRPDVALSGKPSSNPSIGVFDRTFLPRTGRIAEPGLRADLGLQMRPADELGTAIKGD